jgi:hypothetical protein
VEGFRHDQRILIGRKGDIATTLPGSAPLAVPPKQTAATPQTRILQTRFINVGSHNIRLRAACRDSGALTEAQFRDAHYRRESRS